jgi:hypothetical protein
MLDRALFQSSALLTWITASCGRGLASQDAKISAEKMHRIMVKIASSLFLLDNSFDFGVVMMYFIWESKW